MVVLADHNLAGQALLLWGTLATEGWLDYLPLHLATFKDLALPADSDDRTVWRFCQERDMLLLTGNRSIKGANSLEQVIREENHNAAWPVLTVSDANRMEEREYREACAVRLMEIVSDIHYYLGAGRLYLP